MGAFVLSFMMIFTKLCSSVPSPFIVAARSLVVIVINYFITKSEGDSLFPSKEINDELIRPALAMGMGHMLFIFSLRYIPASELAVLDMISMIYAGIFSTLLLNEEYHKTDIVGGLFTLLGVILIAKPPIFFKYLGVDEDSQFYGRFPGYILGTFASICFALNRSLMKLIKRKHTVSVYTMTQWGSFMMMLMSSIVCIFEEVTVSPTAIEWFYIIMVGLSTLGVQILYAKAFTIGNIGTVSACDNVIFFALLGDIIVFGYIPDFLSIMGSLVVLLSCLYIILGSKEK
jgi:drug/metabolite transporter (DMT)-like permease